MPDPARRISVIEPHQFWIAAGAVSAKYVLEFMLMKTRLFSNQIEAHMTPFIGRFVGNVCTGMAASLKLPEKIRSLSYDVDGENILIKVFPELSFWIPCGGCYIISKWRTLTEPSALISTWRPNLDSIAGHPSHRTDGFCEPGGCSANLLINRDERPGLAGRCQGNVHGER